MKFISVDNENRYEIIDQYVGKLLSYENNSYYGYRMLESSAAGGFLLEQKTLMSNEELKNEILSSMHPYILDVYNGQIDDSNRAEIISDYVLKIVSDLSVERPRYNLWSYAKQFLIKEKSSLSNQDLEAEIASIFPELLMQFNND